MGKKIYLTIDVEQDCPPYLKTYRGIESGLPRLCSLLDRHDLDVTFFVTGDVASKYPRMIKEIAQRHEIGCHGYSHRRFDRMSYGEAECEVKKSTGVLQRLTGNHISSFRAPNLVFPGGFLGILKDNGYMIDSSLAGYKAGYLFGKASNAGLLRIPVSVTSSVLRLPFGSAIIKRLRSPVVLFFHPWEFVEMQGEKVRWDCKVNTGMKALQALDSLIAGLKMRGCSFHTIASIPYDLSRKSISLSR